MGFVYLVLSLMVLGQCLCEDVKREKRSAGYGEESYEKHEYGKNCYQCAYSPPKTYYDKKVIQEKVQYRKDYGYGREEEEGYGNEHEEQGQYGHQYGGYEKKTQVPVPYQIQGGWDKCLGPFDHYQAQRFGVDVWECHSNCYIRKDPNGNIFRGCYKGEFNVDPYKLGCHYQAGSVYCFCSGDKCNNGPAPH